MLTKVCDCLAFPPSLRRLLTLFSCSGPPPEVFSESVSNDLRGPASLPQLQLMEGMQLASRLAPESLGPPRARTDAGARERAFGSHRLHVMELYRLRKHHVIRLRRRNMRLLFDYSESTFSEGGRTFCRTAERNRCQMMEPGSGITE